jgi:ribosome-binding factor A
VKHHDTRPRARGTPRREQKTLQLCRQVEQAISQALAASSEPALLDMTVDSVRPAPDAARLAVLLALSSRSTTRPPEVYAALERATGWLRSEVASAITRKRAPELTYVVLVDPGEVRP